MIDIILQKILIVYCLIFVDHSFISSEDNRRIRQY